MKRKPAAFYKEVIDAFGGGTTKRSLSLYKYHVQKAAQDFADAIHPLPQDYPLRDSLPEDFIENFAQLRSLVKDMFADMAAELSALSKKLE